MPYLSRIWLNPLRTGTQRFIRNPHALHAAVLGGLSRQPVSERVLWRLDHDGAHRVAVLVLTRSAPSWEHLVEQGGWPSADQPQALVRSYEPLLQTLRAGQEFAFRVRANPVAATRNPASPSPRQKERLSATSRPRGVRVPHRTVTAQLGWLTDRTARWGFELPLVDGGVGGMPDVRLAGRDRIVFTKGGDRDAPRRVVLQTATYEGRLRVVDPEALRTVLLDGVGPARAYGCGLLTLAPLRGPDTGA